MSNTIKKIMVIDDDPDILEAVQMLLESEGYDVVTSTKADNIEKMHKDFPDLILLDVLLSGMDGRNIAKKLKQQKATKHIPIVMMSAHPTVHRTIRDYLVDDFIAKPFDIDFFINKIKLHV